jgi:hypothetical protein
LASRHRVGRWVQAPGRPLHEDVTSAPGPPRDSAHHPQVSRRQGRALVLERTAHGQRGAPAARCSTRRSATTRLCHTAATVPGDVARAARSHPPAHKLPHLTRGHLP